MKTKITKTTWLSIVIFSLIGQIAWTMENMFYNLYIVDQFNAGTNHIALMVTLSAITATITTLLIGALSDKLGKRKIFIIIGYICWAITILAFIFVNRNTVNPILGIALIIILDCLMTFFGSTANDACYNAYLTDISDDTNRGKIEGINSAMPLVSILIVFGGLSGFAKIDENGNDTWYIVFLIIGALILICGIIGIFTIKEPKNLTKNNENYFKNIIYGFKPSVIKNNKYLYLILAGFAIFGISLQVYMPYYILYLQRADITLALADTLNMDAYIIIRAPAIIIASIFTIFYGKLIDKHSFLVTLTPALGIYLIGLLLLSFFTNTICLFIGCLLMMCGYLSATAVFNAMIRKYTPESKSGLFQGMRIFCSVLIPMLIGPWIGSFICGGNATFGVVNDSFQVSKFIFLGGLIVGIFTIIPTLFVKEFSIIKEKNND